METTGIMGFRGLGFRRNGQENGNYRDYGV